MVDFRTNIKRLRQEKHMTQEELAKRVGVSKAMISAYETEIRYPSYDVLIKLASVFGVTTDYLLGLEKRRVVDITELSDEEAELVVNMVDVLKKKKSPAEKM
ncbi:MAG: helix-turn-helix transcriptional regulator [Clostridia bacterium]|nr:helix-turn-helix transcriptional regulator [Clostridia bacterium]